MLHCITKSGNLIVYCLSAAAYFALFVLSTAMKFACSSMCITSQHWNETFFLSFLSLARFTNVCHLFSLQQTNPKIYFACHFKWTPPRGILRSQSNFALPCKTNACVLRFCVSFACTNSSFNAGYAYDKQCASDTGKSSVQSDSSHVCPRARIWNASTTYQTGMWKRKQKLEAKAVEAVLFLWKRNRENPTASAST